MRLGGSVDAGPVPNQRSLELRPGRLRFRGMGGLPRYPSTNSRRRDLREATLGAVEAALERLTVLAVRRRSPIVIDAILEAAERIADPCRSDAARALAYEGRPSPADHADDDEGSRRSLPRLHHSSSPNTSLGRWVQPPCNRVRFSSRPAGCWKHDDVGRGHSRPCRNIVRRGRLSFFAASPCGRGPSPTTASRSRILLGRLGLNVSCRTLGNTGACQSAAIPFGGNVTSGVSVGRLSARRRTRCDE